MKKVVIFYFSGTGNTYWVAKKIGQALKSQEMRVCVASTEKVQVEEARELIEAADVVGFGYPVYCSDLPEPMQNFMAEIGEYQDKPCFVFCTQAGLSGDGARVSTELLEHTKMTIKWTMHFTMPNNITMDVSPLGYRYSPKEINSLLAQADQKAQKFVDYITRDEGHLVGFHKASEAMGRMQRVPYRKYGSKFRNMISFSPKCTHCGYCEKICPSKNITVTPMGNITYNKCVYCMRCYNFCPHTAIRCYGKDHNLKRGATYKGPTRKFQPTVLFE